MNVRMNRTVVVVVAFATLALHVVCLSSSAVQLTPMQQKKNRLTKNKNLQDLRVATLRSKCSSAQDFAEQLDHSPIIQSDPTFDIKPKTNAKAHPVVKLQAPKVPPPQQGMGGGLNVEAPSMFKFARTLYSLQVIIQFENTKMKLKKNVLKFYILYSSNVAVTK